MRKSTVVGIGAIGFFYVLTLYLGLGAMTSGALDVTDTNMAAPLLARSFGELLFAIISAIAFTTVLGTVSGLILAASGAVAHDLMDNVLGHVHDRRCQGARRQAGRPSSSGSSRCCLGILFEKLNVTFLVGWAFNVAASANLPSLVMLLFWKRTTKQGITAAILVGMARSLAWILSARRRSRTSTACRPKRRRCPSASRGSSPSRWASSCSWWSRCSRHDRCRRRAVRAPRHAALGMQDRSI